MQTGTGDGMYQNRTNLPLNQSHKREISSTNKISDEKKIELAFLPTFNRANTEIYSTDKGDVTPAADGTLYAYFLTKIAWHSESPVYLVATKGR